MQALVERLYRDLDVTQDLGLGMILWMSHFFPGATWARVLRERSLATLDRMWVDPPGYFCREPGLPEVRFAFTNHGVSVGLQAVGAHPDRVRALQRYFAAYRLERRVRSQRDHARDGVLVPVSGQADSAEQRVTGSGDALRLHRRSIPHRSSAARRPELCTRSRRA